MEDSRFDRLSRLLARSLDRRTGLAGIAATAAVVASGGIGATVEAAPSAERCLPNGQRCGKNSGNKGGPCKKCCSRLSTQTGTGRPRRCTCRPDGTACRNSSQCCNGICNQETGLCGDFAPLCTPLGETCDPTDLCCDDAICGPPNVIFGFSRTPRGAVTVCCKADGQSCTGDPDCCGGLECQKGTCFLV